MFGLSWCPQYFTFHRSRIEYLFSEFAQQHNSLNWSILIKLYFPGLAFKHLPINIVIATVLYWGIGSFLYQQIRLLNYNDASVAVWACIVTIGGLDLISRAVWRKIMKHEVSLISTPEITNV